MEVTTTDFLLAIACALLLILIFDNARNIKKVDGVVCKIIPKLKRLERLLNIKK